MFKFANLLIIFMALVVMVCVGFWDTNMFYILITETWLIITIISRIQILLMDN